MKNIKVAQEIKVYEELQSFLNIEDRPNINKEGYRALNYSLESDRAYIRKEFKRFIKANTGKVLLVCDSWDSGYTVELHKSKTETLDGLNSIFNTVKNVIEYEEKIFGIRLIDKAPRTRYLY